MTLDPFLLLRYAHILGAILMGAGLLGVWLADLRSRQVQDLSLYAECARFVALFYDGLVVPGALLLLASGGILIALYYDGLGFLDHPWLVGMVGLFLFEFIEGNTLTLRETQNSRGLKVYYIYSRYIFANYQESWASV